MTTTAAASLSLEEILIAIEQLSVLKLVELIKMIEEKFGVSAAMPVAAVAAPSAETAVSVEEKTEFTIMLSGFGANKIAVIKALREITGDGLAEAKKKVEDTKNGPIEIKAGVPKADAEELKKKLEAAGASVEIK